MDNFDVFARGLGALGAGLTNGGTEARANERLQQLQAKAAMERLLKEAELKQQAEDNARAYAEAQQREFERELIAAQGIELPSSGSSNAEIVQAALNPAPGPMRGGLDPIRAAALFARLDPKAGAGVYNSNLDRRAEYGVDPTPKFAQFTKESDSRVGENEASAYSHRQSGFAAHQLGRKRGFEGDRAKTDAEMERERLQAVIDATRSLAGQRDSAADLSAKKGATEDALRQPKIDKILAQIDTEESKQDVNEARIRKIENDITNDNTLLPAERQVLIERAEALRFRGLLDKARAENDTTRAKAYSDQKAAQSATEAKRQEKIATETGVIGVLGRAREAAIQAGTRLTEGKVSKVSEETRRAKTAADMEQERIQSGIDATQSLAGQRDAAADLSASRKATEDQRRPTVLAKLDAEVAKLDAEVANLGKTGVLTEQKIEESKARVRNRDDLTAAEKAYYEERVDALGLQGQFARTRAENDTTRANAYAAQKGAQAATEGKRQEKLDAETGVVRTLGGIKEKIGNATARLRGAQAGKAEIDEAWQQIEEEQNYERRLAQIDQTRQQYELTKNRTLTEAERLAAAKEAKGLIDARIKNLEARTGQANAQTAMLKGRSAQIAYLLANPGMDQVRDLSRSLTRQATDPKASPKARAQATQQLSALLDQAFPGFSTEPGAEEETFFGLGPTKQGPPTIRYNPQTTQTLQILEQLGAPEKLYADDE